MIFLHHRFPNEREQNVVHGGDIHVALKAARKTDAEGMFDLIKNTRDTWYLGMGDYMEYRTPSHPFFNMDNMALDDDGQPMTIERQLEWSFRQFEKVRKKTVGLLIGNHERKLSVQDTMNPLRIWCAANKVPYLDYMAHVTYEFPSGIQYTMLVHHGYGGGAMKGGKVNQLSRFIKEHDVDGVCIGHVHVLMNWIETELMYSEGRAISRNKVCGLTGSFLKTYEEGMSGYGEVGMMSPLANGYMNVRIHPTKGIRMEPTVI